jgi:hypothetical protein
MAAWIRVGICCSSDLTLNAFAGPDQPESGKGDLEVVSIERSITIVFDSRRSSVRSHSSYLSGGHELSGRSSPLLTLFWLGNGMALDALRGLWNPSSRAWVELQAIAVAPIRWSTSIQ